MSRCLYCGAELNSRTAHFCRGHHRPYRVNLINQWESNPEGSAEWLEATRLLRRFPGWWDYDLGAPVRPNRAETRRTERSSVVARPVMIDYHFRKFGIELETSSRSEHMFTSALNLAKASGINIQVTGYNHNRVDYWKALTDGSLSGGYCREIVSPPFTNESDAISQIHTLTSIMRMAGVSVNNSCGFHLHLDVQDLTPKQIARIIKFYQVYELDIDKMHQSSRRNNPQYTGSLTRYNFNPDNISSMRELTSIFPTRYLKVNVQAYIRHSTIEFRQHGGTLDPVKILNWVKFCTRIVEYAKTDNAIDRNIPLDQALNLSEAEKLYWNYRKETLVS